MTNPNPSQVQTIGVRICKKCYHENTPNDLLCSKCGASLDAVSTIVVPDRPAGVAPNTHLSTTVKLYGDALVLYIMGYDQPVVVKGQGVVTFGRRTPNATEAVDIDLSKYDAHLMGVSRRHARIYISKKGYEIEDVGSANGTFVNERRLEEQKRHLLNNGDIIRLGQLLLYVYFSMGREHATAPVDTTIALVAPNLARLPNGIPQTFLVSEVIPFVSALAEIQHIFNQALNREAHEVTVQEISWNAQPPSIKVTLHSFNEAILWVSEKLMAMKRQYQQTPARIQPAPIDKPLETRMFSGEPDATSHKGDQTILARGAIWANLDGILMDMAKGLLQYGDTNIARTEVAVYAPKLLPLFQILMTSSLEVSSA